jgi:hypothetical protein
MAEQTWQLTRHDLEAKIVKHCWEDEGFRTEFIADPAAAFVKYLNLPAASLPRITVYPEEPGSWHIVLPVKPAGAGELSEAELEKVAGGTLVIVPVSVLVSAAVSGAVASAGATVSTVVASIKEGGW